ncbi:DDE_3 domain-containing protein [Trichonephila clavipes]|nr:DDE_3 domain-containing protein [Trichonephila clavipes]
MISYRFTTEITNTNLRQSQPSRRLLPSIGISLTYSGQTMTALTFGHTHMFSCTVMNPDLFWGQMITVYWCRGGLQDNARPHTARVAQDFLRHFQTLPWPARSPDLSPVEHVWDQLKRQKPSCHPEHDLELAVQDLCQRALNAHSNLYRLQTEEFLHNLIPYLFLFAVSFEKYPHGPRQKLGCHHTTALVRGTCANGQLMCADRSRCILQNSLCDGVSQCRDRSDETGCGESYLLSTVLTVNKNALHQESRKRAKL